MLYLKEKIQILLCLMHLVYSLNLFCLVKNSYLFKLPLEKADISAFNLSTLYELVLDSILSSNILI